MAQRLRIGVAIGVGLGVGIVALDSSIKGASKALNVVREVGAIENEQNTSNGLVVVNNDGEPSSLPTYLAIGTAVILLIMLCPCGVKRIYRAWNTRREESTPTETAKSFPIPQTVHFPRSDSSTTDKEFLRSSTLGNILRQPRISELAEDKEWGMMYPYPPLFTEPLALLHCMDMEGLTPIAFLAHLPSMGREIIPPSVHLYLHL